MYHILKYYNIKYELFNKNEFLCLFYISLNCLALLLINDPLGRSIEVVRNKVTISPSSSKVKCTNYFCFCFSGMLIWFQLFTPINIEVIKIQFYLSQGQDTSFGKKKRDSVSKTASLRKYMHIFHGKDMRDPLVQLRERNLKAYRQLMRQQRSNYKKHCNRVIRKLSDELCELQKPEVGTQLLPTSFPNLSATVRNPSRGK